MSLKHLLIVAATCGSAFSSYAASPQKHLHPAKKAAHTLHSDRKMTAKEIYASIRPAVFEIRTTAHENGKLVSITGSGFAYTAPNAIATALHVIQGAETIDVVDSAGKHWDIDAIYFDIDSDVALLRIPKRKTGKFVTGKPFAKVETGETVFTIGNPLGLFKDTISEGIASGKRKVAGIPLIQMTAAIS